MAIVSGITPKGTIWIKNLDEKGRLISKRVIKNGVQYDTGFRRYDQTPSFILKTDMQTGKQLFKPIPDRNSSLYIKFSYKSLMRAPMQELEGMDKYVGLDYENTVKEFTGFLNKKIDQIAEKLLKSLITH